MSTETNDNRTSHSELSNKPALFDVIDIRAKNEKEATQDINVFIQTLQDDIFRNIETFAGSIVESISEILEHNLKETGNGEGMYSMPSRFSIHSDLSYCTYEKLKYNNSEANRLRTLLNEWDISILENQFIMTFSEKTTSLFRIFVNLIKTKCAEKNIIAEFGFNTPPEPIPLNMFHYYSEKHIFNHDLYIYYCVDDSVLTYAKERGTAIKTTGVTKRLIEKANNKVKKPAATAQSPKQKVQAEKPKAPTQKPPVPIMNTNAPVSSTKTPVQNSNTQRTDSNTLESMPYWMIQIQKSKKLDYDPNGTYTFHYRFKKITITNQELYQKIIDDASFSRGFPKELKSNEEALHDYDIYLARKQQPYGSICLHCGCREFRNTLNERGFPCKVCIRCKL